MNLKNDEIKYDFSFFESEESLLNMTSTSIIKEKKKTYKTKNEGSFWIFSSDICFFYFSQKNKIYFINDFC